MNYALMALAFPALIYVLWVHYVAVMHLKHMQSEKLLTATQKVFGYTALGIGLALDLVLQVFVSALFLELPQEWTVSGRLWRLSNCPPSWRQRLALRIRVSLLDSADPSGTHRG